MPDFFPYHGVINSPHLQNTTKENQCHKKNMQLGNALFNNSRFSGQPQKASQTYRYNGYCGVCGNLRSR